MFYAIIQKFIGEIIFCVLFLTLLGMKKRIFSLQTVLFILLDLTTASLIRSIVPIGIHIGILMITSAIIATALFKSDIIYTFLCILVTTFIYFIIEFLLSLVFRIFHISINDITTGQSLLMIFNSITDLFIFIVAYVMYKLDFQIQKKVFLSKRLSILLSFIFASGIILGLQFYFIGTHVEDINIPLYSLLIILFIIMILIIYELIRYSIEMSVKDKEFHDQKVYLKYINELVDYLRGQRHEFVNHINVLYGLVQINDVSRLQKAKEYIEEMDIKVHSDQNVLSIQEPIISGLLCTKLAIAEQKNIHIDLEVSDDLDNIPLNFPEIAIVLGNLIDNAIEFTQNLPNPHRKISISIMGSDQAFRFIIKNNNNGHILHETDQLFEKGYTTKTDDQEIHGFGLYNVKKIVRKYKGTIEVSSNKEKTYFEIKIPKLKKQSNTI